MHKKVGIENCCFLGKNTKGVRRVLWVFTSSEQIMIAENDGKWQVLNWDTPVEVVDGCMLNIQELIDAYED